jgi:hypothetical protein
MNSEESVTDVLSAQALGELGDEYWITLQDRLQKDRESKELKEKESALYKQIIDQMLAQKLTSIGGKKVKLSRNLTPDYVPTIQSYDEFAAYVLETQDLSLLERRVSKSAVKERWEQNQDVPGVVKFPVWKLSKSQVKG